MPYGFPAYSYADTPAAEPAVAFQRNWKTPCWFRHCPAVCDLAHLEEYAAALVPGVIFEQNRYGETPVIVAQLRYDCISVVVSLESPIKPYGQSIVFIERDRYCHQSGGMFWDRVSAMDAHAWALDLPWVYRIGPDDGTRHTAPIRAPWLSADEEQM